MRLSMTFHPPDMETAMTTENTPLSVAEALLAEARTRCNKDLTLSDGTGMIASYLDVICAPTTLYIRIEAGRNSESIELTLDQVTELRNHLHSYLTYRKCEATLSKVVERHREAELQAGLKAALDGLGEGA